MRGKRTGRASIRVWSLYILECEDGSLYTGISPDPVQRFAAHRRGRGAAYTRMRRPRRLLAVETVGSYGQALKREWQVKKLSKKSKLKLVEKLTGAERGSGDT